MRFVAVDVETANADMASICAIGAATFQGGKLCGEFYELVDPEDDFDLLNVSVHGISERMVAGKPTFAALFGTLCGLLQDAIVVTHTHFDRVALHQAAQRCGIEAPVCRWLDTAKLARRVWPDCARSGYGLLSLCHCIGYEFQHHHALEDAKAAAQVLLTAIAEAGLDLEQALRRTQQPIGAIRCQRDLIRRQGDPNGPLYGEVVVFTGALEIPRTEAADIAARLGCEVASDVTKKTTMLVVGNADLKRLAGHDKSTKHRKVEDLISRGVPIRIIREADFLKLFALA